MAIMAAIDSIWDSGDDAVNSRTPQDNRQRTARSLIILEFDPSETRVVFYHLRRDDTVVAALIQRDCYDFTRQNIPSHVFTSPDWESSWAPFKLNIWITVLCLPLFGGYPLEETLRLQRLPANPKKGASGLSENTRLWHPAGIVRSKNL